MFRLTIERKEKRTQRSVNIFVEIFSNKIYVSVDSVVARAFRFDASSANANRHDPVKIDNLLRIIVVQYKATAIAQ